MIYHESLSTCLETLRRCNLTIDDSLLILRDVAGRLTVCKEEIEHRPHIEQSLREALKQYAAAPPLVDGALARRLLLDESAKPVASSIGSEEVRFRYLDRRLIGADWLIGPKPKKVERQHRIVFASLKGGVGRTTALAVAAANLARRGLRILAIDLDLEAPGIGAMLLPRSENISLDRRPKFGAVDYLLEEGLGEVPDHLLIDFIGKSTFAEGFIDVVPAVGRTTDENPVEFMPKLSRALTDSVAEGEVTPLWCKVEKMVSRFGSFGSYDVVLIDARAGLSEISAAPLLALGANIFLFATDQDQTFLGYRYLLSHISAQTDYENVVPGDDWRENLTFVHSKAPPTERQRMGFRERVYDLCSDWLYEEEDEYQDSFSFSPSETGPGIPHDATFIRYDTIYDVFDPTLNGDQLNEEVYFGPFGSFLSRLDSIVDAHRE